MTSRRTILGFVLTALILTTGLTAPAGGDPAGQRHGSPTDAVTTWNEIAVTTLVGLPPTAGGAPSAAPIHVAMVQGAVYDAVTAIGPRRYEPYLLKKRFSARASKQAAVATAAHAVLAHIVSTVPNIEAPARATLLGSLETQYENFLTGIRDGRAKARGIAAGNAAARAMIAAREDDGRFGPSPWVPNPDPGHWTPLTDPTGQALLDPTPWVGAVQPFFLETPSQFRTRGPKALTSAGWAREFNEVKALGSVDSTVRTEEQTYIARWWQSQPTASWNSVARQLVTRRHLGVTSAARLFALQNLSTADAAINCWNDKYHYDFWRPWNAIPRAAEDGNPATEPQAGWAPLVSAPYPEHPSGHLCLDAASVHFLRTFFGNRNKFEITSASTLLQSTDEPTRSFRSFRRTIAEIVEARIWAGLHYRTADLQGKNLGQRVATYAAANYLRPRGGDDRRRSVVPADKVAGSTGSRLLGDWFVENLSRPADASPFGQTANLCLDIGRRGKVLAPAGGIQDSTGTIEMTCTAKVGRPVVMVMTSADCSSAEEGAFFGRTAREQRACVVRFMRSLDIRSIDMSVDDRRAVDIHQRRFFEVSRQRRVVFPENAVFGAEPGPATFVAAAWMAEIRGMKRGHHTVTGTTTVVFDGDTLVLPFIVHYNVVGRR